MIVAETVGVVYEHREFGHVFEVRELAEPDSKGRKFRLYDNGFPASGGQWHRNVESAKARIEYIMLGDYESRIRWLENRVQALEAHIGREGLRGLDPK